MLGQSFRMVSQTISAQRQAYAQLKQLFPQVEKLWLQESVKHYNTTDSDEIVRCVAEKITDHQSGFYPREQNPSTSNNNDLLQLVDM